MMLAGNTSAVSSSWAFVFRVFAQGAYLKRQIIYDEPHFSADGSPISFQIDQA